MRKMLSFIAFHGITDIYKRSQYIIPLYSLLITSSILVPVSLLNTLTIILSSIHFSEDNIFNEYQIFFFLSVLLYYGEQEWSQNIMLGYMSCIHTPLHFYRLQLSVKEYIPCICFLIFIYQWNGFIELLKKIVVSGGREPNTITHKMLLGVINGHILCNIPIKRFYWDSNPGLQIQSLL